MLSHPATNINAVPRYASCTLRTLLWFVYPIVYLVSTSKTTSECALLTLFVCVSVRRYVRVPPPCCAVASPAAPTTRRSCRSALPTTTRRAGAAAGRRAGHAAARLRRPGTGAGAPEDHGPRAGVCGSWQRDDRAPADVRDRARDGAPGRLRGFDLRVRVRRQRGAAAAAAARVPHAAAAARRRRAAHARPGAAQFRAGCLADRERPRPRRAPRDRTAECTRWAIFPVPSPLARTPAASWRRAT